MDMFKKIKPLTKRLKVFLNIPGHPGKCFKKSQTGYQTFESIFKHVRGSLQMFKRTLKPFVKRLSIFEHVQGSRGNV